MVNIRGVIQHFNLHLPDDGSLEDFTMTVGPATIAIEAAGGSMWIITKNPTNDINGGVQVCAHTHTHTLSLSLHICLYHRLSQQN